MAIVHTRTLHRIEFLDDKLTVDYIDAFDDPDDDRLPVRTHTQYVYTQSDDVSSEDAQVIAVRNAIWGG